MHIQQVVDRREQAEKVAQQEVARRQREMNAGIEQMLTVLLFIACFGTGLFICKIIDEARGPGWAAVVVMAISAGAFFTCLKRLQPQA